MDRGEVGTHYFCCGNDSELFSPGGSCRISAVVLPVFHLSELINTKLRPLIIEYINRVDTQLNDLHCLIVSF